MASVAAVEIGVMVGSAVLKAKAQSDEVSAKEAALRRQQTEQRIAASQQMVKEDEKASRVLSAQNLMAGASGVTAGSFSPIEEQTFNDFAEDRSATKLQLDWKEHSLQQQEDNLEDSRGWMIFGDLFSAASSAYKIGSAGNQYPSSASDDENLDSALSTSSSRLSKQSTQDYF